jgi:hypothetical protein
VEFWICEVGVADAYAKQRPRHNKKYLKKTMDVWLNLDLSWETVLASGLFSLCSGPVRGGFF